MDSLCFNWIFFIIVVLLVRLLLAEDIERRTERFDMKNACLNDKVS